MHTNYNTQSLSPSPWPETQASEVRKREELQNMSPWKAVYQSGQGFGPPETKNKLLLYDSIEIWSLFITFIHQKKSIFSTEEYTLFKSPNNDSF